jgi:hypothetical protein
MNAGDGGESNANRFSVDRIYKDRNPPRPM